MIALTGAEALGAEHGGELGPQNLDGDLAIVPYVGRERETVAMPPAPSSRSMR